EHLRRAIALSRRSQERARAIGAIAFRQTQELEAAIIEDAERRAIVRDPAPGSGGIGEASRIGEDAIELRIAAERGDPTEQVHLPVANGAGRSDRLRER